jgi:hypothetical protein
MINVISKLLIVNNINNECSKRYFVFDVYHCVYISFVFTKKNEINFTS